MQSANQELTAGRRTTDSFRAHALNVSTKLRDGIARVRERAPDAPSQLISLCGNLDELDRAVCRTIALHPSPIPADLIELHARIEKCIDAAMDLAGSEVDEGGPGLENSASKAFMQVQHLLALVDPTGKTRMSAAPSGPPTRRQSFV
jgi:hypothetical protein